MKKSFKISIIIPCYNSATVLQKNLPYLFEYIENYTDLYEIILVNDGSKDENQLVSLVSKYKMHYISYFSNMGKGYALKQGFLAATGDIQIFTDPDIPYTCCAIEKIIEEIQMHQYDMVIGDRLLNESIYFTKVSTLRRFGSLMASKFLGKLLTRGIFDTQCGLKGFSKSAAEKLFKNCRINRFAIDIELIFLALKYNFRMKKIPVQLRSSDGNTVKLMPDGLRFTLDTWRIKYFDLRKKYS